MKKTIEIFTAGCPFCEPAVQLVKETASDHCEIIIHNLSEKKEGNVDKYSVKSLPAVAVNGKLLGCCNSTGITKTVLIEAGI